MRKELELQDKVAPDHYPDPGGEDLISLALRYDIGFAEFNVMKYVFRWKKKNGLEDLFKAKEYLERLIDFIEENGRTS